MDFRKTIRGLKPGQWAAFKCRDGRDINSKRSNAYALGRATGARYVCTAINGGADLMVRRTA